MSVAGVVGTALVGAGIVFIAITALGLARFPDFFSRAHVASKAETLGVALVLVGLIAHEGATLASAKLGLIIVFIAMTSPVGAHALTRAAVRSGVLPWRRPTGDSAGSSAGGAGVLRAHSLEGGKAPDGAGEGA